MKVIIENRFWSNIEILATEIEKRKNKSLQKKIYKRRFV